LQPVSLQPKRERGLPLLLVGKKKDQREGAGHKEDVRDRGEPVQSARQEKGSPIVQTG
jgi:hypothetical protein